MEGAGLRCLILAVRASGRRSARRTARTARGADPSGRGVVGWHANHPEARRHRLRHGTAAGGLGDHQRARRSRRHAHPGLLFRQDRARRHGLFFRLHAKRADPDRLLHRVGDRHGGTPGEVRAALHLQGLPVRSGQLAVEPGVDRGRRAAAAAGRRDGDGGFGAGGAHGPGRRGVVQRLEPAARADRAKRPVCDCGELRGRHHHRHARVREERVDR